MDIVEEARDYLNPKDVQVVVYHKGCHDGQAAALCAWRKLGDGDGINPITYIPMHYKDEIRQSQYRNKNVVLLDFSWTPEVLAEIRQVAKKVMILDHHKSAMENLSGIEGCFFDMEESGASLAWMYFSDTDREAEEIPFFIVYVRDRDLWKWEYREVSEPMYYALRDLYKSWNSSFRDYNRYIDDGNLPELIDHGKSIMQEQQKWIEEKAKEAKQSLVELEDGNIYHIMHIELEAPKLCSELAEYLYTNNNVHLTVCWFRHKDNKIPKFLEGLSEYQPFKWWYGSQKYILSLRTNCEGIDVSKIAQMYGGGGHAQAAGCSLDYHPSKLLA